MEILVFSDSHGRAEKIRRALERQPNRIHAVFFLGDGLRDVDESVTDGAELYTVCGNCDWFCDALAPTEQLRELGGFRILATHGHAYSVKSGLGALIARAIKAQADVVLFGHTHRPHFETLPKGTSIGGLTLERPIHLFNPGSIGYDDSFGTITIRGGEILFAHGNLT